jgi:hypothetical protein
VKRASDSIFPIERESESRSCGFRDYLLSYSNRKRETHREATGEKGFREAINELAAFKHSLFHVEILFAPVGDATGDRDNGGRRG